MIKSGGSSLQFLHVEYGGSMKRIVFTGGPCGGKTTTLMALKQEFGDRVIVVPEPATMLMSTGFPVPGRDLSYTPAWQDMFQSVVSPLQLALEGSYMLVAQKNGAQVMICDRGILDGAAYHPGGLPAFLRDYRLEASECYGRYDEVVHLESTATCNPSVYGKGGNETRYESLEEAQALEMRIRDAWNGHPRWSFISGADGIGSVIARAISIVSSYIDIEIERKWVLPRLPQRQFSGSKEIRQGYLVLDQDELRIRQIGDEYLIAVKGDGTITRDEWERPLPAKIFRKLWPMTQNARVEKTRNYAYEETGHVMEVDVYHGPLSSLVTMECEFATEEDADAFVLPDWAVGAVDVTADPRFKNKNLAQIHTQSEFQKLMILR
jgi:CYTH domain-containing protein/predicted ATPase